MGKGPFSFRRSSVRRRSKKTTVEHPSRTAPQQIGSPTSSPPLNSGNNNNNSLVAGSGGGALSIGKGKKKTGGCKLWMRFDRSGRSELVECDKSTIIRRASIPARDLRILGPVFSHSSNILGTLPSFLLLFSTFNLGFILMLYSNCKLVMLFEFVF